MRISRLVASRRPPPAALARRPDGGLNGHRGPAREDASTIPAVYVSLPIETENEPGQNTIGMLKSLERGRLQAHVGTPPARPG